MCYIVTTVFACLYCMVEKCHTITSSEKNWVYCMIACDGVCELVILQMQKSPGTALRPLPETSCQRKLKANNSTTAKAVQELKILSKVTICCGASVWSERIKVNVILNFCFIFSDSRLVSFPNPLALKSSFSRLTFQVRRRTCLGKATLQLYIFVLYFQTLTLRRAGQGGN